MHEAWKEVTVARTFKLSLPAGMTDADVQAIDSTFHEWQGNGVIVRVDAGLFADPLTSYAQQRQYVRRDEAIAGHVAQIVSFDTVDGSHVVGAHFATPFCSRQSEQQKLTVVVEVRQSLDSAVAFRILRSIACVR